MSQDLRISLVQGPPGTGKTACIVGMISALLVRQSGSDTKTDTSVINESTNNKQTNKMGENNLQKEQTNFHSSSNSDSNSNSIKSNRVLLCAPSNCAVDELLLRLMEG